MMIRVFLLGDMALSVIHFQRSAPESRLTCAFGDPDRRPSAFGDPDRRPSPAFGDPDK